MRVRGISCLTDGRYGHLLEAMNAQSCAPALEEPHREPDELSAFGAQLEEAHTRLASHLRTNHALQNATAPRTSAMMRR